MAKGHEQEGIAVKERPKTKARKKRPSMYRVLIHNDDFTPMEFVVMVLRRFFHLSPMAAEHLMLQVHHLGKGVAGVYTKDVAQTKVNQVHAAARQHGHPLLATLEEDTPDEGGDNDD